MVVLVTLGRDEDGHVIVECHAIPGCVSQGATEEEALSNIKRAIRECIAVRRESGQPSPLKSAKWKSRCRCLRALLRRHVSEVPRHHVSCCSLVSWRPRESSVFNRILGSIVEAEGFGSARPPPLGARGAPAVPTSDLTCRPLIAFCHVNEPTSEMVVITIALARATSRSFASP